MKEQCADLFLFYHQKRESVERFAAYACLGFLLIAAMSRSVVTKASIDEPDTWDYLGGGIDNGFLIIMGPVAIVIIAIWFNRMFSNCLKLRNSLEATVKAKMLGDDSLTNLEQTLITEPLSCPGGRSSFLRGFLPRAVFIIGFVSVLILLAEYARFRPEGSPKLGWLYLLIGEPYLQGFEPVWPRFPEKRMPWVYPPWYTIGYSGILYYLGFKSARPPSSSSEFVNPSICNPDVTNNAQADQASGE